MGKKKRLIIVILWSGIFLFVIMGLFPPWSCKIQDNWYLNKYHFIGTIPKEVVVSKRKVYTGWQWIIIKKSVWKWKYETARVINARIDTDKLIIQWLIVVVLTGGVITTIRMKNRIQNEKG